MLARRASVNARLSGLNNKWRMLIVIPTATALIAYAQMFGRTRLACFNNLKVNSVVIEFIVDGLVCEIMFTSVPAGVDPSTQARTQVCFCIWAQQLVEAILYSTQPVGSMLLLPIDPSLPMLISRIPLKT